MPEETSNVLFDCPSRIQFVQGPKVCEPIFPAARSQPRFFGGQEVFNLEFLKGEWPPMMLGMMEVE